MENEILEVKPIEEKITEAKPVKQKLTPVLALFEDSINVWWKNLKKFVLIYLWGLVYSLIPMALIAINIFALDYFKDNLSLALEIAAYIIIFVSILAVAYFSIQAYAGMFLLIKNEYNGDPKEIYKNAKISIIPYVILMVLTGILLLLWTLLLIIPGIIFSIFYSLAVYVFFFEGKTGMSALKRSTELVKDYWWAVAVRFGLFTIAAWIFGVIISIPMLMVPEKSLFWEIWNTLVQIINMLISPIALLFSYQVYLDLVKIKK